MKREGMTLIVKTITRLITGFILLFGFYVVVYGHITPGGGFSGGVVIALALILTLLAFGNRFVEEYALLGQEGLKRSDVLAALAFLVVAVLGYFLASDTVGRVFFGNWIPIGTPFHLWSGGIVLVCNVAVGVKVATSLFAVLLVLAAFHNHRRYNPAEPKEE